MVRKKEETRILEDDEVAWGTGNKYPYEWIIMQQLQRIARFLSEAWQDGLKMYELKTCESSLNAMVGLIFPYLKKKEEKSKKIQEIQEKLKKLNYKNREDRRKEGYDLILEYFNELSIFLEDEGYYKKEVRDME